MLKKDSDVLRIVYSKQKAGIYKAWLMHMDPSRNHISNDLH